MYNVFRPVKKKKKAAIDTETKQLKYPKAVFFIVSNEFCERFSYYGMRTVLVLYVKYLGYSEDDSTIIFHTFVIVCYFSPLFGAIVADTWLGRFRTILYVSIWYALGQIVMAVGSIHSIPLNPVILCFLGLMMIGTGTGGIKPCVSTFGGDQFVLPEQEKQLDVFFSVFYFSINAGSLISSFVTPLLRQKISCFGSEFCFPFAFGLPAVLMLVAVVIFALGKPLYKIYPRGGVNVVLDITMCISHAIVQRCKGKDKTKDNFLDYANDKYDQKLIDDIRQLGKVALIYAPTIIFWALYEQQGSRWTFQASRMNLDVFGYIVPPDQMQTINSVLVLIFIPLFEAWIYPFLFKTRLVRTSLHKMIVGGYLAALAFVISAIVQLILEKEGPFLPTTGSCHLKIINALECPIFIYSSELEIDDEISAYDVNIFKDLKVPSLANQTLDVKYGAGCKDASNNFNITLESKKIITYMLTRDTGGKSNLLPIDITEGEDIERSESGDPAIKVLYGKSTNLNVELKSVETIELSITNHQSEIKTTVGYKVPWEQVNENKYELVLSSAAWIACKQTIAMRGTSPQIATDTIVLKSLGTGQRAIQFYGYTVYINGNEAIETIYLKGGGVYALLITDVKLVTFELITITPPAKLNVMWQMPQYIVITAAEIMFSITGIQFGFTQAPLSMRSLVSSLSLIADALGNVIVIIVARMSIFSKQSYEFFLFSAMMALDMAVFVLIAMRYVYIKTPSMESFRSNE